MKIAKCAVAASVLSLVLAGTSFAGGKSFDELDTNRDGYLRQSERQRAGAGLERLDRNRDGALSRSEFQKIENVWSPRTTGRDQRVFRELDRNNDNRLSRTELGAGGRFDTLDRNRDGVISPREWPRR